MVDGSVGSFAGSFGAVKDDSARFSVKAEEVPVEGGDFSTAAGALLKQIDDALAYQGFKRV